MSSSALRWRGLRSSSTPARPPAERRPCRGPPCPSRGTRPADRAPPSVGRSIASIRWRPARGRGEHVREEEALGDLEALLVGQRALELGVHRLPRLASGPGSARPRRRPAARRAGREVPGQGVVDRLDVRAEEALARVIESGADRLARRALGLVALRPLRQPREQCRAVLTNSLSARESSSSAPDSSGARQAATSSPGRPAASRMLGAESTRERQYVIASERVEEILWTPPPDVRETTQIGRFLDFLRDQRGHDLPGYDELFHWSVTDLEGFWGALWDFFGVRAHTPYERVLGATRCRAPSGSRGRRSTTPSTWSAPRRTSATTRGRSRSRRRATPFELTFGELREQVGAARGRAEAPRRRAGRPRGRLPAEHPRDAGRVPRDGEPRRGLGHLRARVRPAQRDRPLRHRRAQAAARDRRLPLRRQGDRPARRGGQGARRRCRRSSTSSTCPTSAATDDALPDAVEWDDLLGEPGRSSSTRSRSTTRSTCCSRRARPGCRRRSCTATAASSSSTSRTTASAGTSSPATG